MVACNVIGYMISSIYILSLSAFQLHWNFGSKRNYDNLI